jgi:hypothetical protein
MSPPQMLTGRCSVETDKMQFVPRRKHVSTTNVIWLMLSVVTGKMQFEPRRKHMSPPQMSSG